MSAELAAYQGGNNVARWVGVLAPAAQLAERIAGTEFVPKAMRGKPDVVTAAIMYGDEIGIGPMQALAGIHVVEGRPAPSAELLRAMILREGHSLVVHEMTGTRCRMSGLRRGAPEPERLVVEWTLDMGRSAGLLGKDNWRKYPRAMLAARCTGDLARLAFPDVVKGLGNLADTDDDALYLDSWAPPEQPAPRKAPRKAVQRRTRPPARPVDDAYPAAGPVPSSPVDEAPVAPPLALPRKLEPWADDQPLPAPDMPDPSPEPAPVEPDPDVNPKPEPRADAPPSMAPKELNPALLRALHASLGRALGRGPDADVDRNDRLRLVSAMVGHDVDTTNNLTRKEAMHCLDVLAAVASGGATWEENPQGGITIVDLREPPEDEEGNTP